ncbi:MAG: hypothetical protein FJY97_08880 [candidate division Zixibacteria bacterium]|nr:hypothetical protein [candidate division Zixibacteria bacterium]
MEVSLNLPVAVFLTTVSRVSAVLAVVFGATGIVLWLFAPPSTIAPIFQDTPLTTLAVFITAGISLWLLVSVRKPDGGLSAPSDLSVPLRWIAAGLALAAGFVEADALLRGVSDPGSDLPLGSPPPSSFVLTHLAGLMASLALPLLVPETRCGCWPAQTLGFSAGMLVLLAIIGHVYASFGLTSFTGMSLSTAVVFLILCLGIVCARPDRSMMAILTSDGAGGAMARRLTVAVIAIPSLLGWLRLEGERLKLYDPAFGISLLVVSIIICFFVMIWWYAGFLNRSDIARLHAEAANAATRRELEEQRTLSIRADRLRSLGEMAAGMAHELNQPLVGVRGLAEHLTLAIDRGWALPPDKIREKLSLIIDQADRMTHIIQHVRLFSREAGKPETQPTRINDVARSAVGLIEEQFRSRGMVLQTMLGDDMPEVDINPFSMEEVFLNLLVNARDATEEGLAAGMTPEQAVVTLRTWMLEIEGETAIVAEVSDRGIGIPPEVLPRVFDPFFTAKWPDRGTGLGLPICKSIVEQFGGTLRIISTPGKGTSAEVTLKTKRKFEE